MQTEDKKILAMRNWLEPKLIKNLSVFFYFANFYQRFIQNISKMAKPLTLILRMSSTVRCSNNLLLFINVVETNEVSINGSSDYENKIVKKLLSKNLYKTRNYLTPNAILGFTQLRKVFIKTLILYYFDPKCCIQIETDASR